MSIVATKSYAFAIQTVIIYRILFEERKEFVLSKQLLRSGTSIGAQIREAEHAQSAADFLHKMNIALKEANETEYWISLLKDTGFLNQEEYLVINQDCSEILKLLISIVKTTKNKLTKPKNA
jgi:four helix bundle protein